MPKKDRIYHWEQVPLVLDIAYASVLLGVHPETVRRKLSSAELNGKKIGREWRILKSDIMSYLGVDCAANCTEGD